MLDRGRGARLGHEALAGAVRSSSNSGAITLSATMRSRSSPTSAVDDAHPAAAHHGFDPVTGKQRTRGEQRHHDALYICLRDRLIQHQGGWSRRGSQRRDHRAHDPSRHAAAAAHRDRRDARRSPSRPTPSRSASEAPATVADGSHWYDVAVPSPERSSADCEHYEKPARPSRSRARASASRVVNSARSTRDAGVPARTPAPCTSTGACAAMTASTTATCYLDRRLGIVRFTVAAMNARAPALAVAARRLRILPGRAGASRSRHRA